MADDAYYVTARVSPRRKYTVYLTKAARARVMQAAAALAERKTS